MARMIENQVKELLYRHGVKVPVGMTVASGEAAAQPRSGPVGRVGVGDSTLLAGMVQVEYAAQWPGGDLADRYRFHNAVGIRIEVETDTNVYVSSAARCTSPTWTARRMKTPTPISSSPRVPARDG